MSKSFKQHARNILDKNKTQDSNIEHGVVTREQKVRVVEEVKIAEEVKVAQVAKEPETTIEINENQSTAMKDAKNTESKVAEASQESKEVEIAGAAQVVKVTQEPELISKPQEGQVSKKIQGTSTDEQNKVVEVVQEGMVAKVAKQPIIVTIAPKTSTREDEEKFKKVGISLPPTLYERLKEVAYRKRTTINKATAEAVEIFCSAFEEEHNYRIQFKG